MSSCYICEAPIEHLELDGRDNKTKPCSKCLQIVQKCVEAMERRDKAKEKRMMLWHNEVTGEYSIDNLDEDDPLLLDEDVDEILDGFHLVDEREEDYE